jgi:hypothetical protein
LAVQDQQHAVGGGGPRFPWQARVVRQCRKEE